MVLLGSYPSEQSKDLLYWTDLTFFYNDERAVLFGLTVGISGLQSGAKQIR
jgi:hypothetical protein